MRKSITTAALAAMLALAPSPALAAPQSPPPSPPVDRTEEPRPAEPCLSAKSDTTCAALQPTARKASEGQIDFITILRRLAGNGTSLDGIDPAALRDPADTRSSAD